MDEVVEIQEMQQEFAQLDERLFKLKNFVESDPKFKELSKDEQEDRIEQLQGMTIYRSALLRRCHRQEVYEEITE